MHASFFLNLPVALLTAWGWAFIAFLIGRRVKRHATIDVFWGSGFLVVFLESLWMSHGQSQDSLMGWWNTGTAARWAVLVAVAVWSLRLTIHLWIRQIGSEEDSRYVRILKGAKGGNETLYALRVIYGLQGVLMWFVSIPLQWIAFSDHFVTGLLAAGLALVAIGVFFEAVGDEQLRRFIANPANAGTTMNRGLWRFTRHPNYFGDAVTWTGLFLCACAAPWGWATILSPAVMWYLLTSLSGKPMLEAKLTKTRAGYQEYVATTSSFFPRPPKRV